MTFPLKENLYVIEQIAKRQHQIYPDSADFGVKVTKDQLKQVGRLLKELKEFYKGKTENWGCFKGEKWNFGGSKTTMFIPFEIDEGLEVGITLEVSYNRDQYGKEYLTIYEERSSRPVRN